MTDIPSHRRFGVLIIGAALIVVGAVLAAFAVFAGDPQAPAPEPSPTASCNIFDPECEPGPQPTIAPTEPEPSSPPGSTNPPGDDGGGLSGGAEG